MSKSIQAVRGMNDLLPDLAGVWRAVEDTAREVLSAYGYREIRLPIVEKTELYARSIGEVTDIVEKEMYTFEDRNGDSLTLRPEGTAGCVRAGIEHGLLYNQVQRLWYIGPMFRHERPQKGRYRQFHQVGVEAFGLSGPDIDVEIIAMSARLWRRVGIASPILQLNSLGVTESRAKYREELVAYFGAQRERLDEDSQRRLHTNPLRILDSKNPQMAELVARAPQLIDHLDAESRQHFDAVCSGLDALGIRYEINPRLVRGLDYYSRTVFEWISSDLGAQGTICAGGRYDGLVEQLGGKPTAAIGFALGLERLVELCGSQMQPDDRPDVYIVALGVEAEREAQRVAEMLRDASVRTVLNCGGGNVKKQMQRADRSGAQFAVLLGDSEVAEKKVSVKDLRNEAPQQLVEQTKLADILSRQVKSNR